MNFAWWADKPNQRIWFWSAVALGLMAYFAPALLLLPGAVVVAFVVWAWNSKPGDIPFP